MLFHIPSLRHSYTKSLESFKFESGYISSHIQFFEPTSTSLTRCPSYQQQAYLLPPNQPEMPLFAFAASFSTVASNLSTLAMASLPASLR